MLDSPCHRENPILFYSFQEGSLDRSVTGRLHQRVGKADSGGLDLIQLVRVRIRVRIRVRGKG